MQTTLANVTETTTGELVSTTDLKKARFLGRRLSVRALIRGRVAHYELVDGQTVLIYAASELYELKLA